jgi:hypothetical protein
MRRARSTDRAARSGIAAGVTFLGGIAGSLATSDVPYPRPGSSREDIAAYFGQRPSPVRFGATGQILSAVALGRFAASVAGLAGRAGAPALKAGALAGGGLASASLAASAAHAVALARDPRGERAVTRHRRMFLAGGPAHGAGFGALLASLGVAGLRTGELPRPLAVAALATAVPNLLSPLYLAAEPAAWLVPIGRFPGLIVTGAAGATLARA